MHKLTRQVRFSISPFLPVQPEGFNSYASKPTGDGLSFYLSLWVELEGKIDADTGFIVNVSNIDRLIREELVPVITARVQDSLLARKIISVNDLAVILGTQAGPLGRLFLEKHGKRLKRLKLELNPFRSIYIDCNLMEEQTNEGISMFTYSEKFEFAAMHKLWNDKFSPEKNLEVFGKCANPAGHGHNYILEAAVLAPLEDRTGRRQDACCKGVTSWISDFQHTIKTQFIDCVDHKNLNVDVEGFQELNPTVENLAFFAWQKLKGQFSSAVLSHVTVWENDRTYCTYSEDLADRGKN